MPRTRRARMARAAIICLALGVVTTVAIAWSLGAWMPIPQYPRTTLGAFVRWERPWGVAETHRPGVVDSWWGDEQPENPGRSPREIVDQQVQETGMIVASRPGSSLRTTSLWWGTFAASSPPTGTSHLLGSDTGYGWPLPCLWFQVLGSYDDATHAASATALVGGVLISRPDSLEVRAHSYRALPLLPIWPGLAADTGAFSAGWFLLLFAPGAVRRASRRRRGRCSRCGYDIRTTPSGVPCPECGDIA